jgi:hypothetical protein
MWFVVLYIKQILAFCILYKAIYIYNGFDEAPLRYHKL